MSSTQTAGLSRRETFRRRTRTLSRIPYLLRFGPTTWRLRIGRLWFYADDRYMGYTRREAWDDACFWLAFRHRLDADPAVRRALYPEGRAARHG